MLQKKSLIFFILLALLIADRVVTLTYFGFQYTDIDQVLQWEGALDYSHGIFKEPFFYGQDYNYMVESFLSVPLLWLKIPVYYAVPICTSFLSLFPFVTLAIFFYKKEHYFFSYLCLAFPILLPLEFNFLTTMSRGFVQAGLFVPLLYFAIFNPKKRRSITLFFIGSALCFLANPSSAILIFPVGVYLLSFHFKSIYFYLNGLLVVPFLILSWLSKEYYVVHPEKLIIKLDGIDLEISALIEMITRPFLFEYLFPFFPKAGFTYLILFVIFIIWIIKKKGLKKEFLFILSSFVILVTSLSIPKVIYGDVSSGVFYTHSRLYILLPLVFIILLLLPPTFSFRKV